MGIKRVSAKEAVHLAEVGYVIVDVRTVGEYQKGHPKGALNVPFLRAGRFELKDNPDFLPIVEKLFADKGQKLLLAGKIGKRSLAAAEALAAAGYTELCELRPGYVGLVDDRGRFSEEGWERLGLPTETQTEGGSYREIRERLGLGEPPRPSAAPSPSQAPPAVPGIKRVSAKEAVPLQSLGYTFVDVRDPSEYAKGHPTGAVNVPWQLIKGFGLEPNPDFLPVMEKLYPDKAHRLLVVGKIGKRSLAAAEALRDAGYTELCELRPGYLGIVDDQGRYLDNGWKGLGLPSENETEGGSYAELCERVEA